jgi:putative ABC transport system substrate-binding protein
MRRREFLAGLGGSIAASTQLSAQVRAQAQGELPTIGMLMAGSENSAENKPRIAAFRKGLADHGWKDGDNVRLEVRWSAGKRELIQQYAKELVELHPTVILANSTPVIQTFKGLTSTIPVVFALSMDPVGLGQVKSLAHPGGNFTGFTFIDPELIGKWMQLLKDVVPGLTEAALLYNPTTVHAYANFIKQVQAAHRPAAVTVKPMAVKSTEEMQSAMAALAKTGKGGVMIGPDPFNQVRLKQIADLAMQLRLPTVSVYRPFVQAGGLMMYGPDTADVFRRSADYVDRVLKGANPGDLPVQQPNKFEFVFNLKTAKALGLAAPPTLLATTDEVIE